VYAYLVHVSNRFDLFKIFFYHCVYLKVWTVPEFLNAGKSGSRERAQIQQNGEAFFHLKKKGERKEKEKRKRKDLLLGV
jgi:hypothetical protein